jgi:hypothetical protein
LRPAASEGLFAPVLPAPEAPLPTAK